MRELFMKLAREHDEYVDLFDKMKNARKRHFLKSLSVSFDLYMVSFLKNQFK